MGAGCQHEPDNPIGEKMRERVSGWKAAVAFPE